MLTDRAKRKPIPKSYLGWQREVDGIEKMLKRIAPLVDDNGEQWVRNMQKYSKERLAVLKANKPKTPLDRKR